MRRRKLRGALGPADAAERRPYLKRAQIFYLLHAVLFGHQLANSTHTGIEIVAVTGTAVSRPESEATLKAVNEFVS